MPQRVLDGQQPLLQGEDALARSQPRAKLDRIERLGQKIVGFRVVPRENVLAPISRREDDDVYVVLGRRAKTTADVGSVRAGHDPIENGKTRTAGRRQLVQRSGTVAARDHLVPEILECALEHTPRHRVVVSDQDSHLSVV